MENTMPSPNRADHTWAKDAYKKAKKIIFASQTVCGICGRPVDFGKKFPDPWSATVDHIVPISKGGNPADIANMQLAHLQCNRLKSSKTNIVASAKATCGNRELPLSIDYAAYRHS